MKKVESNSDVLREEYDLAALRVRKLGPGHKGFGDVVRLEPDVSGCVSACRLGQSGAAVSLKVTRENRNELQSNDGE